MVDRDLLDDRAAQREPDECNGRVADGLDQIRRVARERLERPGKRDLAFRRADASVVERRAAELVLEERNLIRVPVRRQAAASRHPDDVRPLAVLHAVQPSLGSLNDHDPALTVTATRCTALLQ